MDEADREEQRRLNRNQQDNATNQSRLRAEYESFLRTIEPIIANVAQFLMHPEKGTVVRVGRLETRLESVETHLQLARMDAAKVGPLEKRIVAIEDARTTEAVTRAQVAREAAAAKTETRKWALRDVLVPTLLSILAAVITAAIVIRL